MMIQLEYNEIEVAIFEYVAKHHSGALEGATANDMCISWDDEQEPSGVHVAQEESAVA